MWGKSLHKKVLWKRHSDLWQDKIYNKLKNLYAKIFISKEYSVNIINALKFRKIEIYGAKKNKNGLIITIKYGDIKKVFAICKELCYNKINIVGFCGKSLLLYHLIENCFLILGLILTLSILIILSNYIYSFSFSGTGSVYKLQVEKYLNNNGITKYSKFSDVDYKKLSSDILRNFDNLTFVECYKKGNVLNIELVKSNNSSNILTGDKTSLKADCDGELISIKVYSGTLLKSIGEKVKSGETIVDGYALIKDNTIKVNVIATAIIKVYNSYTYSSSLDNQEEVAKIFAMAENIDIIDESNMINIEKQEILQNKNTKYIYKVNYYYKKVIFTG